MGSKFQANGEVYFIEFEKSITKECYTLEKAKDIADEIHDFILPLSKLIE